MVSGKNSQCFSVTSNRWSSVFFSLPSSTKDTDYVHPLPRENYWFSSHTCESRFILKKDGWEEWCQPTVPAMEQRVRGKILSRLLSLSDQEIKGILPTLSISILLESASPALDASPGFQWQPPSYQKAWAMPHFWGICQAQSTVAPGSEETFLPRLPAEHLGKITSLTPFFLGPLHIP